MVYEFYLSLSSSKILNVYRGRARHVIVRDRQGVLIQLGVDKLLPFVNTSGVHGWFRLDTDSNNKFVSLQRLEQ